MLEDGSYAYAFFNLSEEEINTESAFAESVSVRDVWAKEDIANSDVISMKLYSHTVKVIKCGGKITEFVV